MRIANRSSILAAVVAALATQVIAADAGPTTMPATAPTTRQAQQGTGVDPATITTMFTVDKVDQATRTVSLKAEDGSVREIKCGPEVRNFEQIKPGDRVALAITEEIAVDVRPGDAPARAGEVQVMERAPEGAKPGATMVQSEQITAKILAVDPQKGQITLQGPDGRARTIKVDPKVDLSQVKQGDSATVQFIRATAIVVAPPEEGAQMSAATMPAKD